MPFHDNCYSIGLHCVMHYELSFVNFMLYSTRTNVFFLVLVALCLSLGLGLKGHCLGLGLEG